METVLITNDDGITAPGIRELVRAFSTKYKVIVSAPSVEQSGKGHSFTYREGLTFDKSDAYPGIEAYMIHGTPADCVKVALSHILDEMPDYVIAGVNGGENLGVATYYSGTAVAAREGAFWRLPSVAFSTSYQSLDYMAEYADMALLLFEEMKEQKLLRKASHNFYNVNFPGCSPEEVVGHKICRQSMAYYNDLYTIKKDKDGNTELFVDGGMREVEEDLEYDIAACRAGYVAITPISIDATESKTLSQLKSLETVRFNKGDAQ